MTKPNQDPRSYTQKQVKELNKAELLEAALSYWDWADDLCIEASQTKTRLRLQEIEIQGKTKEILDRIELEKELREELNEKNEKLLKRCGSIDGLVFAIDTLVRTTADLAKS